MEELERLKYYRTLCNPRVSIMEENELEKVFHQNVEDLKVSDLTDCWKEEPPKVREGDPIWKMVSALVERPASRTVYVLDSKDRLVGMISYRDIIRVVNARLGARDKGVFGMIQYLSDVFREDVATLMRRPVSVRPSTNLLIALERMEQAKMNDLPIVDDNGKLLCDLGGRKILQFALEDIKRGDEESLSLKKSKR
jgi:CBS domain-containing protein